MGQRLWKEIKEGSSLKKNTIEITKMSSKRLLVLYQKNRLSYMLDVVVEYVHILKEKRSNTRVTGVDFSNKNWIIDAHKKVLKNDYEK